MRKPGLPTSIRLPPELKAFLKRQAEAQNRKLSKQIIHILQEWRMLFLRNRNNPKP